MQQKNSGFVLTEEVRRKLGTMVRLKRIREDNEAMAIQSARGSIPIKRVIDPEIEQLVIETEYGNYLLTNEHLLGTDMTDREFYNLYGIQNTKSLIRYVEARGWVLLGTEEGKNDAGQK